jgi:hypothetical protein
LVVRGRIYRFVSGIALLDAAVGEDFDAIALVALVGITDQVERVVSLFH